MPARSLFLAAIGIGVLVLPSSAADDALPDQAAKALRRAVDFYRQQVSSHGGYVYRYSFDLKKREGEGKTGPDTVWVQPPGTPAVGMAYVAAFERTGDPALLEAANSAAECLIRGQLRSGGWTNSIDFDPDDRRKTIYRVDPPRSKGFNVSTFDDDKTQSALRFLTRLDQATGFKDKRLHEAIRFALDSVVQAQYPNGAWGQGWDEFPDPAKYPIQKARYPESWSRTYPGGKYWFFYTFNDNAIADTIEALLLAERVYREPRYRAAALQAGDFILRSQLPEPQPAWAQQYDYDMHPCWARKFEPPAVTGSESQGVMQILLRLYIETGDRKFLEPIPRAIGYLRKSLLPDGRLARFYELHTNKPLYLTRDYVLTYDDGNMPTHYGFKVGSRLDDIERQYERLSKLKPDELAALRDKPQGRPTVSKSLESQVRNVIAALDDRGAWVEEGRLNYHGKGDDTRRIIDSRTFIKNADVLSRYLAAVKSEARNPKSETNPKAKHEKTRTASPGD